MAAPASGAGLGPGFDHGHFNLGAHHQRQYRAAFHAAVAAGELRPLVFPWSFVGSFFLPLVYLSIPHTTRPWLYRMRWPVAAAVVFLNVRLLQTTSAANEAVAYATGLIAVWGTIWALRLLIFTRPQWDAARVERRPRTRRQNENGVSNGTEKKPTVMAPLDESVAAALQHCEYIWQPFPATAPFLTRLGWTADLLTSFRGAGWTFAVPSIPHPPPPHACALHNQPSSSSLHLARLDLTPLASRTGTPRSPTYRAFLRSRLLHLALSSLTIDLLTIVMRRDPYFVFGPAADGEYPSTIATTTTTTTAAATALPPFLTALPCPRFTIPLLRNLAALAGILAGLHLYPAVLQLATVFLLPALLPTTTSTTTSTTTAVELWRHPALFGGFGICVLDRGLAGFWGGWWHQLFREGFVAPARWVLGRFGWEHGRKERRRRSWDGRMGKGGRRSSYGGCACGGGGCEKELLLQLQEEDGKVKGGTAGKVKKTAPRGPLAKAAELLLAFLLSGLLHAAGGYTGVAARGRAVVWTPVAFFGLQAVGVLLQGGACALLRRGGILVPGVTPRWLRRAGNLAFVVLWLHLTCWGLIDDMSRAGLWLFEPVPVSPLRAMGFGPPGESWWRWDGEYGLRWYSGRHWWESGIRL